MSNLAFFQGMSAEDSVLVLALSSTGLEAEGTAGMVTSLVYLEMASDKSSEAVTLFSVK
jgi:hypothetical protein